MKSKVSGLWPLAVLLAGCTSSISIEERDVPQNILHSFQGKYPQAYGLKWRMGKKNNRLMYVVDFRLDQQRVEADFTKEGVFLGEYVFKSHVYKESDR